MDPILAEIYGTNQESDLEKLAAAELSEELSSDDQIEMLAQQVLNDAMGQTEEEETPAAEGGEVDDETMAKVAEADKLGRIMAHSMWQELGQIKQSSPYTNAEEALGSHNSGGSSSSSPPPGFDRAKAEAKRAAQKNSESVRPQRKISDLTKEQIQALGKEGKPGMLSGLGEKARLALSHASKTPVGQHLAKKKGLYGAGAGALGLGAVAAKKYMGSKSKQSSALNTLAEARAMEILNSVEADPAEQLTQAVEARAMEMIQNLANSED